MSRGYRRPNEYDPGSGIYETDKDLEVYRFHEANRKGSADMRLETLRRDQYQCRTCGKRVTIKNSHVDHIKPVKEFARFALACVPDNCQTLCLDCHNEKHYGKCS